MFTRIWNNTGSALTMVIMCSGAALVIMTGATQWIMHQMKNNAGQEYQNKAFFVQSLLLSTIQDQTAWMKTTELPANGAMFDCLASNSCTNQETRFILVRKDEQVLLDSRNPSHGFTLDGAPCNEFNATAGSTSCPFRFDVTWEPDCRNCPKQQAQVKGTFTYSLPDKNIRINKNLNFTVTLGKVTSLASHCLAVRGKIDSQNSERCILPVVSANPCGNGQVMIGADHDTGRRICRPLAAMNSSCPSGYGAVGFGAKGDVQCVLLNTQ